VNDINRTRLAASVAFVLVCLGFGSSGSAQDSGTDLKILDADANGPIILAQNKKKKKKDDEESEEGEEAEETETEEQATTATLQRGNRMEFDGRLIKGETAGSGAVFLFERAPRPLPSMVTTRRSYLSETVDTVLGDEAVEQFEATKVETMKEIEKKGESERLKAKKESKKEERDKE